MKAEELMIGDWVYNTHNRQPEQVCETREHMVMLAYNDLYDYDEIEPIPLTSDILERNGFCVSIHHENFYCLNSKKNIYTDCKDLGIWSRNIAGDWEWFPIGECKYIHDLQHALRQCGIEKEIIL